MTHTTIDQERESGGSTYTWFHTIDITGLDAAGAENYDPASRFGAEVLGVDVVGQEDETVIATWDHVDGQIKAKEVTDTGDGTGGLTDIASGTAVGELVLRVDGK